MNTMTWLRIPERSLEPPHVAELPCTCGHAWDEHFVPGRQDQCRACGGSGVSDTPDPSELPIGCLVRFGADRESQLWLACPHCNNGILKPHCVAGCDCTEYEPVDPQDDGDYAYDSWRDDHL